MKIKNIVNIGSICYNIFVAYSKKIYCSNNNTIELRLYYGGKYGKFKEDSLV